MTLPCVEKKIDSNVVGLLYAEEDCLGTLPDDVTPGDEAGAVWYPLDPNDYQDMGAEIKTVVRNPINSSRQRRKGVVSDIDAAGGFNQDLTQSNLQRIMQGFFFADAHEKTTTHPISGSATPLVVVANYTAASQINVTAGHQTKFIVGSIVKTSGNSMASNNVDNVIVTALASGVVDTDATTFVAETVGAASKVEIVGYQFATGIATIEVTGATVELKSSGVNLTTLGLNVGEWIFVGGEAATAYSFVTGTNVPGYARVVSIAAASIHLDQCTWTPVDDTAAAKTIRIYFGTFLRNEKTYNLIKRRTYQLERSLGNDGDGPQYEYLIGAVPNEFKLNVKAAEKITCDLSFVATNADLVTGLETRKIGASAASALVTEDGFNTSSDIYQMRLFIHDAAANTPSSLFAYVMDATINIKNNASGLKAVGNVGSFDVNIGDFEVGGTIEAYFATVAAVQAVKDNADVSYNMIAARENAGFVYDLPLISLGGGKINVKKDSPVMIPLTNTAAENEWGYTLSSTHFTYLPDSAMPSA